MTLTVSKETFTEMLKGLVASGCIFKATEKGEDIVVEFNGSF